MPVTIPLIYPENSDVEPAPGTTKSVLETETPCPTTAASGTSVKESV